jgi:hypothetical protein
MFAIAVSGADRLQNMIYILCFVVYFAYPEIYRSTSIILMLAVGCFIIGQYAISLVYKIFFVKDPVYGRNQYDRIWIERLY